MPSKVEAFGLLLVLLPGLLCAYVVQALAVRRAQSLGCVGWGRGVDRASWNPACDTDGYRVRRVSARAGSGSARRGFG